MKHKHAFSKQLDSFSILCRCGLKVSGIEMASRVAEGEYQDITISKNMVIDYGKTNTIE